MATYTINNQLVTKWSQYYALISKRLTGVVLFFVLLFSGTAFAQVVQPSQLVCNNTTNPRLGCTSNDLQVVSVFVDAPACESCTPGDPQTYTLKMTIHNGTNSIRPGFALYGTLSAGAEINGIGGDIFVCVGPITVKSNQTLPGETAPGNQTFEVGEITFECGQELSLTNNILAWTDASGNTADRCQVFSQAKVCADVAPKCGNASNIVIRAPLSATAEPGDQPCTNSTATDGSIFVDPSGGLAPYRIYVRERTGASCPTTAPTGTADATSTNGAPVEVDGLGDGTYCIYVIDANNCTFPVFTQEIGQPCCVAPPKPTVCEVPQSNLCPSSSGVTIRVGNLQASAYYTVTQTGTSYSQTQQAPATVTSSTTLEFTGLETGKGFNVTGEDRSSTPFCTGLTATCADGVSVCAATNSITEAEEVQSIQLSPASQMKVFAAPNPYNDRIRFRLESDVSGQGSLELYNTLGQRVKTLYQGHIEKGVIRNVEYSVPKTERAGLIYLFRVGNQKTTGKLLGIKQ